MQQHGVYAEINEWKCVYRAVRNNNEYIMLSRIILVSNTGNSLKKYLI
jgi:hypothetical protein